MGVEVVELLREAVLANLDNFNSQLQSHFDDMFENGRIISFRVKVWDDWDYDLETEDFGDDELGILIEDWISDNTVNNRFTTIDATESMMFFDQVRIPLYNEKGRAIDARRWANGLRKYLRNEFEIESKLMTQGLGQAQLVIGSNNINNFKNEKLNLIIFFLQHYYLAIVMLKAQIKIAIMDVFH